MALEWAEFSTGVNNLLNFGTLNLKEANDE
jgi:hypothetical protein